MIYVIYLLIQRTICYTTSGWTFRLALVMSELLTTLVRVCPRLNHSANVATQCSLLLSSFNTTFETSWSKLRKRSCHSDTLPSIPRYLMTSKLVIIVCTYKFARDNVLFAIFLTLSNIHNV